MLLFITMDNKQQQTIEELNLEKSFEEMDISVREIVKDMENLQIRSLALKYELLRLNTQYRKETDFLLTQKKIKRPSKKKILDGVGLLSDQMCVFLNKPEGTISNHETIYNYIVEYTKKNRLSKKNIITFDKQLAYLFGSIGEQIHHLDIHERISEHLILDGINFVDSSGNYFID